MPIIQVVPYQTQWRGQFLDIGKNLREAVGDCALRIDHIGSTAIPGLAAKPIIDVQLTTASLEIELFLKERLAPLGLLIRPANNEDRPPPWELTGPSEWRKLYFRTDEGSVPRLHLHVRAAERRNQRYAILFRDYLRANNQARDAYGLFKQTVARLVGHLSSPGGTGPYLELKDPVLDLLASSAEQWAQATSWCPGPSDA